MAIFGLSQHKYLRISLQLQRFAKDVPVDDVSPGGTSGAQTGISIPGDGDDQAQYMQPALGRVNERCGSSGEPDG